MNNGFPANFIPGSGSVPDEIVETILSELMVLMHSLATQEQRQAGIYRITQAQERACSDLWLKLRDQGLDRHGIKSAAPHVLTTVPARPPPPRQPLMPPTRVTSVQAAAHHTSATTPSSKNPLGPSTPSHRSFSTAASSTYNEEGSLVGTGNAHSPYLVQRLLQQEKLNLYGIAKFAVVADEIRKIAKNLDHPVRILDLGCSTSISKHYLLNEKLDFEYCGVDYEEAFQPDICMDVRDLYNRRNDLPWEPDVILLLDVLEHLPGKSKDIARVMSECDKLIPRHGVVLAVVPQLYRMDRLKLSHLHYPEHQVRFTLDEWHDIISKVTTISGIQGIGYLSCLPYLPMLSPFYLEDNLHGSLFRFLRGSLFEWSPLKPVEKWLSRSLGTVEFFKGWCNSTLLVCRGSSSSEK